MDEVRLEDWLEQLAAKKPSPGGGGAAALAAASGAALISMVCRYTLGEKWADVSGLMTESLDQAEVLREQAIVLMDADAKAYDAVRKAYSLPKETLEESGLREWEIQNALEIAVGPPSAVIEIACEIARSARKLLATSNPNLISDVGVAAAQAKAAIESAVLNVEINIALIQDPMKKRLLKKVLLVAEDGIAIATATIEDVRKRIKG